MPKQSNIFEPKPYINMTTTISNYRALKNNVNSYVKAGKELPPALQVRLPELRSMEASLRRQGLIK